MFRPPRTVGSFKGSRDKTKQPRLTEYSVVTCARSYLGGDLITRRRRSSHDDNSKYGVVTNSSETSP